MTTQLKRWGCGACLIVIVGFAITHLPSLRADFPNHSQWMMDEAKYTDEGWYGNAAIREHLTGNWYLAGDFNPAVAMPIWPFLEWIEFSFTGVTVEAARGLAISFFFANLLLTYLLFRRTRPLSVTLVTLILLATSPYLYCFSRLAIVEPSLATFVLGAIYVSVLLEHSRHPIIHSFLLGLLLALMMLTKPTAVFLLPAVAWALWRPLWKQKKYALRYTLAAGCVSTGIYGLWLALVIRHGLLSDYLYLFISNKDTGSSEFLWPLILFLRAIYAGAHVDGVLLGLASFLALLSLINWRRPWVRELWHNPIFGASMLGVAGYTLFFITHRADYHYFYVVIIFSIYILTLVTEALINGAGGTRWLGWAVVILIAALASEYGFWTMKYVLHPQYTFVDAAEELTRYVDQHPNGRRILVSESGDDISLIAHLPALGDAWGTQNRASKIAAYQPGWYATWNYLNPGVLQDIHRNFSIEQVGSYRAFDKDDRNLLVLFELHPLARGLGDQPIRQNLKLPLPEDRIGIQVMTYEDFHRERIRYKIYRVLRNFMDRATKWHK